MEGEAAARLSGGRGEPAVQGRVLVLSGVPGTIATVMRSGLRLLTFTETIRLLPQQIHRTMVQSADGDSRA